MVHPETGQEAVVKEAAHRLTSLGRPTDIRARLREPPCPTACGTGHTGAAGSRSGGPGAGPGGHVQRVAMKMFAVVRAPTAAKAPLSTRSSSRLT
ncbi:hypothetical protein GTW71_31615 [Streptomyces sp. SID6041]|nr:hypothetical protein [Streptomyces sp. SID6041]